MSYGIIEREQWAETEAKQFERNAAELDSYIVGWLSRPHPDNYHKACEIAIKAQVWRDAARALRQPHYARLEHEALQS